MTTRGDKRARAAVPATPDVGDASPTKKMRAATYAEACSAPIYANATRDPVKAGLTGAKANDVVDAAASYVSATARLVSSLTRTISGADNRGVRYCHPRTPSCAPPPGPMSTVCVIAN